MARRANDVSVRSLSPLSEPADHLQEWLSQPEAGRGVLRALVESSPNPLALSDPEGRVVLTNLAFSRLLGEAGDALCGRKEASLVEAVGDHAGDRARVQRAYDWFRTCQGCPCPSEGFSAFREHSFELGSTGRYYALFWAPVAVGEGAPGSLLGVADVSEVVAVEEQLRALVEAAPTPLVVIRWEDGTIRYANRRVGELLGAPSTSFVGRSTEEFVTQRAALRAELEAHGQLETETELELADGSRRWVLIQAVRTRVHSEDAVLAGFYDLTLRREAEAAMRQSEERFRSFVENSSDVVLALGLDGTINYLSPNVAQQLGYQPGDLLGASLASLVHADDEVELRSLSTDAELGTTSGRREMRLTTSSGGLRWFSVALSPLRNSAGEVRALTGSAHDVHEQHVARAELERNNQRLMELHSSLLRSERLASLGMLVAGIAHEINTPVGAIASMQDTLVRATGKLRQTLDGMSMESDAQARVSRLLSFMDDANRVVSDGTERVTAIVQRLRAFARSDDGQWADLDLSEALEDTVLLMRHQLKRGIRIEKDLEPGVVVRCRPGAVKQVLLNLVVNARQAIPDEGIIRLSARLDGDQAVVVVGDSGEGICPENMSRLFEAGFTTKCIGTGLGLAISREIVAAHEGQICVESQPGCGSTFTLRLPRSGPVKVEDPCCVHASRCM